MLTPLPDTPERAQSELALLVALFPPLTAIRGAGSPDVEWVYTRARVLCQDMVDSPQRFAVLAGLHLFYISRGELKTAHELGGQLLPLAQHLHDPILVPAAHIRYGVSAWFLGDFRVAQTHFETAWTLYRSQAPQDPTFWSELDPVSCGRFLALTLLCLGYPDQAQQQSLETLALAQELGYPLSQMVGLLSRVEIHELRGELQVALEYAERAMTLGQEHGFAQYSTRAVLARGRIIIVLGQLDEGVRQMQKGLAAWRSTGMEVGLSYHLARLAEAHGARGQTAAGFRVLSEAQDCVKRTGERAYESELYRLRGELTLQAGAEKPESEAQHEVEADFHRALEIARHQGAKRFELSATMSLARLCQHQDKRRDAYDLLAPVYGWFTEGFDTADLKDAKALLEELS